MGRRLLDYWPPQVWRGRGGDRRERLGTGLGMIALLAAAAAATPATSSAQSPNIPPPEVDRATTGPAATELPADDDEVAPAATQPVIDRILSLDELLETPVTLVSRKPERVAGAASAVQVLTGEDIQRSGALTLPEALRLASNLQVAQVNAYAWAITARGLNGAPAQNNAFANKLLVMIDGRSVYSPLFAGVFWDVQNVLLEDVDRIEIVSGPGGTLWGANAVNGVINVVTKSARDTQGLYITQAAGNVWESYTALRYGGRIGEDLYYRVYGLGLKHDNTYLRNGDSANDDWYLGQGGFRLDHYPNRQNTFTLQGDLYEGREGDPTVNSVSGGNVLGRFTHIFSDESDLVVQAYYDGTSFSVPAAAAGEDLRTFDIELQHRFPIGKRHDILWGLNYRLTHDDINNSVPLSFDPEKKTLHLFSGFIQDEITLVPDRLRLTLGTKVEHNEYSGVEWQPSARLAYTPSDRQTIWAAVSRAVRSPSRFDVDVETPFLTTPRDFKAENVIAYEVGYRVRPIDPLALSIAGFYHDYDDLRSIDLNPNPGPLLVLGNNQKARTYGMEVSGELQVTPRWRLRGGYTLLLEDIEATAPGVAPGADGFEANDPRHQVVLHSIVDLPANFQFDTVLRYADTLYLSEADVPAHINLDVRLAWHYRNVELALVGQNLLDDRQPQIGNQEIPRSLYGRCTIRW